MQVTKVEFQLISGLVELTCKTKITAEMQLVANIFGWNMASSVAYTVVNYCEQAQRHILNRNKINKKHATLFMTTVYIDAFCKAEQCNLRPAVNGQFCGTIIIIIICLLYTSPSPRD